MDILLHEGTEHTETAASSVGAELSVAAVVGVLVLALVASYVLKRYSGGQ